MALYLRDVVRLLLANRTERPLEFIHQYFRGVLNGNNVVLREFAYVNASSRNRLSFIMNFEEAYKGSTWTEPITADDYHQLMKLICPDFPLSLVKRAVYMVCSNHDERIPFADISLAVQVSQAHYLLGQPSTPPVFLALPNAVSTTHSFVHIYMPPSKVYFFYSEYLEEVRIAFTRQRTRYNHNSLF
jgi:hypothetical protein